MTKIYNYAADGTFTIVDATPEEDASLAEIKREKNAPVEGVKAEVERLRADMTEHNLEQDSALDDVILLIADMIGGI